MMGGLAFMVNDKMVACVGSGDRALLVRIPSDRDAEFQSIDGARRADMGEGRSMGAGWIRVDQDALADEKLHFWIDAALAYNATITARTD